MANEPENLILADGRTVPKACVDALNDLDERWSGATFAGARAAIAAAVLSAVGYYEKPEEK